jgi:peptidoglycan-associated lipoprotein
MPLKLQFFGAASLMPSAAISIRVLKAFALVALLAFAAACSRTRDAGVGNLGPGATGPGTQQEFLVTIGDRVFFEPIHRS